MAESRSLIPVERIEQSIRLIRGHKIMLDSDLASLYEVETKALVRAVKRNLDRFPEDFMFQLSQAEFDDLRHRHWHLKCLGRSPLRPLCFHRAGGGHALERPAEPAQWP